MFAGRANSVLPFIQTQAALREDQECSLAVKNALPGYSREDQYVVAIFRGHYLFNFYDNKWYEVKRLPLIDKLLSIKLSLSELQSVCFSKCVFMPFFSANAYIYSQENLRMKRVPSIAMK